MAKQGIVTRRMVRQHENAVGEARYLFEQAIKYKKYASQLEARLEAYMAAQMARFEATGGNHISSFEGSYDEACEFFGGAAYTNPRTGGVYAHTWHAA